jgi:hypothetical protein
MLLLGWLLLLRICCRTEFAVGELHHKGDHFIVEVGEKFTATTATDMVVVVEAVGDYQDYQYRESWNTQDPGLTSFSKEEEGRPRKQDTVCTGSVI